jgi:predicted secreted protein
MAETSGQIKGTGVLLSKDVAGTAKAVANLMANSFTVGKNVIDVSSKSSGEWAEFLQGRKNWTMTCESITEYDTSVGAGETSMQDVLTDHLANTTWTVVFGSGVVGDPKITGTVIISNFTWDNPDDDKSTFSVDLQGTGAATQSVFA